MLPALAQVSEAVIDSAAICDSATSTLISFGTAADLRNRDSEHGTVEVVAVAGGPAGEAVRILRLSEVHTESEGRGLTHWVVNESEEGFWVGHGSLIQQVCFSEDDGQLGGLLAIRCPTGTTILRPVLRRRPVPSIIAGRRKPHSKGFQPSLLDPNPIGDLPINLTGVAAHVDVTFNPWDQHQLAVLDTNGRWSIWNIEEQFERRTVWTVRAGFSGNLPAEEEHTLGNTVTRDTWGIILWVYSPTTILIARRNTMLLHDTTSGLQQMLGHGLGLDETSEWIFDVQRNPRDSSQLFVLTSSCIFWLRVTVDERSLGGEARAHILLARRHFRSHEDRGLQISVSAAMEGIGLLIELLLCMLTCPVTMVVLYSQSSTLATVFTFAPTSPLQLHQSISDPLVLPLRNVQKEEASGVLEPQKTSQGRMPSTLCMRPLTNPYSSRAGSEEPGEGFVQCVMPFYQAFVLHKDLGVSERVYILVEDGPNPRAEHLAGMTQFKPAETLKAPLRKSFVVPDAFISDVEGSDSANEVSDYKRVRSTARRKPSAAPRDPWMFDLRWLATAVKEGRSSTSLGGSSAEVFAKIIDDAMANLDDQTPGIHVL